MLTTGLDGASNTTSASAIAVERTRCRGGLFGADEGEAVGGHLGAVAHPPLLEVDGPLSSPVSGSVMTTWVSLRSSVAGSSRAPGFQRSHSASVTCRQRIAGPQHLAADQVGGQVAVAEPEPVGLHAVGGEFLLGVPGFVAVAPAPFGVDTAT